MNLSNKELFRFAVESTVHVYNKAMAGDKFQRNS